MKSLKTTTQILLYFILIGTKLQAQYPSHSIYGIGMDFSSSGNGHGGYFAPSLSLTKGRNTFSAAVLIQKRSMTANGARISLSRNLTGSAADILLRRNYSPLQLNIFANIQYNDKLPLSYCTVQEEETVCRVREPQPNWNAMRLSTIETTFGLQLNVNITGTVAWKTYIGTAAYYHFNYYNALDHPRTAVTICLGTGVNIQLPNL